MLGVAVFIVIAVLLGWGLTKLFKLQLAGTVQDASTTQLDHGFDPDTVYVLKRNLLVGRTTAMAIVLYPSRDDLPPGTPNRQYTPTLAEYHAAPADYPDIAAVIPAGTRVRFPGMSVDHDNAQTAVLLDTVLLDGRYAGQRVTAYYLEREIETPDGPRIVPREDLLQPEPTPTGPSGDADEPIQSLAP